MTRCFLSRSAYGDRHRHFTVMLDCIQLICHLANTRHKTWCLERLPSSLVSLLHRLIAHLASLCCPTSSTWPLSPQTAYLGLQLDRHGRRAGYDGHDRPSIGQRLIMKTMPCKATRLCCKYLTVQLIWREAANSDEATAVLFPPSSQRTWQAW